MERVMLADLPYTERGAALAFLKRLWREEGADCPFCGAPLELLHQKTKKNNCDWQCRPCGKVYRTISLFDELNQQIPN